jgi:hypothetical protein
MAAINGGNASRLADGLDGQWRLCHIYAPLLKQAVADVANSTPTNAHLAPHPAT